MEDYSSLVVYQYFSKVFLKFSGGGGIKSAESSPSSKFVVDPFTIFSSLSVN